MYTNSFSNYSATPFDFRARTRTRVGTRLKDFTPAQIRYLYNYYNGDHWLTSFAKSRLRNSGDDTDQATRALEIEKEFVSCNKVREIIDRHTESLVGHSPGWYFVDLDGQVIESVPQQLDIQLHDFLKRYEEESSSMNSGRSGRSAIEQAIIDAKICGKGYIRVYNPNYYGIPLTIHSPDPLQVFVGRDGNGYCRYIKYTYSNFDDETTLTEHQMIDPDTGLTVFRTLVGDVGARAPRADYYGYEDAEVQPGSTYSLDLGGRFSLYEVRLNPLLTIDLQRLQDALNYVVSMMVRNLGDAGHAREWLLNALPPGQWLPNDSTNELEYVQEGRIKTNPGAINFVQGIPSFDELGHVNSYTSPQLVVSEPSSVEHFTQSFKNIEEAMYRVAKQGHVLADISGNLSGVSREKLQDDFRKALEKDSQPVRQAIISIYSVVLMMLNADSPEVIKAIKDVDLNVDLNIDLGSPTGDEIREARENYSAGLISAYTTRVFLGVDDPEDEAAKVEEEQVALAPLLVDPLNPNPADNPTQQNGQEDQSD